MGKHARRAQLKIKCTSTKFCNAIMALNLATFMLLSNRNNNKNKSGNTQHTHVVRFVIGSSYSMQYKPFGRVPITPVYRTCSRYR